MINIVIAVLALAVGIYVGSIIFGNKQSEETTEPKPDSKSPVVDSFIFRKPPTKHTLIDEVLDQECYKCMCHFDITDRIEIRISQKYDESLNQLAEKIMQWYNPEYNELLIIAHRESTSGFVLDWTWKKPSSGAVDELGR